MRDERGDELRKAVQDWLANWFAARGKVSVGGSKDAPETVRDTDYFAAGWLTSMEVVEFVTEIERQFAVQFTDHDLQDQRFVTIAGLTELILERSTQTSDSR